MTTPMRDPGRPEFNVGDLVWVEVAGSLVFERPVRILDIHTHDDGSLWAVVEGAAAAVPVDCLTAAPTGDGNTDAPLGEGADTIVHVKPTARPIPFQGDLRNLPDALAPLKELPNWVCWRWEWKVNKKGVGKWDKPPFRPDNPTIYAKNNDPATWGTYEQAFAAFEDGKCDGIGINLLGTDIAAFDIDKCRDPATGDIAPEAMVIVNRTTSYTEMTVSGTGLRVIGYGNGTTTHRKQKLPGCSVKVESYSNTARYIVVTGNPLPGTWPHMADISAVIKAIVDELDDRNDGAEQRDEFDFKPEDGNGSADAGEAFLPHKLRELIKNGAPPHEDLSAAFHHAVCWLGELGWSAPRIEAYIAGKAIVPDRYAGRLGKEIARCLHKAKSKAERDPHAKTAGQGQADQGQGTHQSQASPFELFWHGKEYNRPRRSWLVKELIPETGQGLASGQWGTAKTFIVIDLAASIMTATPFAGQEICRRGGVLFIAAEGASEIPIRLKAVVEQKLGPLAFASGTSGQPIAADLELLPFAWIEDCPNLQDNDSFHRLMATAKQVVQTIRDQFDLPLALIVIDTLSAAGNFKDANDAAEGQFIMNRLGELSRQTGAFVLAVDHFGKAVETGTRGTSAKEAAADVVLALLANRAVNGTLSNTHMALRKLRGGKTGTETPFDLKVVDLDEGETTCVIEWKEQWTSAQASTAAKRRWPTTLRVFEVATRTALLEHGKQMQPYGSEGPTVTAVPHSTVRHEFVAAYPADASNAEGKQNAKRMAFTRALKRARDKELICSREISGIDYLWLVEPNETKTNTTAH